ncbi:hypothetical protein T03_3465 [Trichinella britovi]|uniref:Uncharacterized protein n=1 Tax=Trichinella britovi TaxID=45882 RepID=A0A0V0Z0F9_TRIBR|nr:hypothetical protein T03_3465 [Trichinella britovi]
MDTIALESFMLSRLNFYFFLHSLLAWLIHKFAFQVWIAASSKRPVDLCSILCGSKVQWMSG